MSTSKKERLLKVILLLRDLPSAIVFNELVKDKSKAKEAQRHIDAAAEILYKEYMKQY